MWISSSFQVRSWRKLFVSIVYTDSHVSVPDFHLDGLAHGDGGDDGYREGDGGDGSGDGGDGGDGGDYGGD